MSETGDTLWVKWDGMGMGMDKCAGSFGVLVFPLWPGQALEQQSRVTPVPNASGHGQSLGPKCLQSCIQSESGDATKTLTDFNNSR